MKYRFEFIIMISAILCLLLTAVAPADTCYKRLYVDGVFINDSNATSALDFTDESTYERITIGAESNRWYLYNEYIGSLDEFAVYDGILNDTRIKAHYDANASGAAYTAAVQLDDPLLWLRFDDPCTAHDYNAVNSGSITAINGQYVITGGGPITNVTGIAESDGIYIPGTVVDEPGHCVDVWDGNGDFSYLCGGYDGPDLTVEIWVKFTDINAVGEPENDFPRFFQHNGNWNNLGSYGVLVQDPNQLGIIGGNEVAAMGIPYDINDNKWHHIVVTYDSTVVAEPTERYPEEIMADGPVLYVRFEDEDPCDSSGNNFWVDYQEDVTIQQVKGSMGKCAYLNGGWVAAANQQTEPALPTDFSNSYAFSPNDLTVEFWLYYPGTVDAYAELWTDCNSLRTGTDPILFRQAAGRGDTKMRQALGDPDGSDPYAYSDAGAWATDTGTWHHYVAIWDEAPETNDLTVQWWTDGEQYKNTTYNLVSRGWNLEPGPAMDHILFGGLGSRDNFSPGNGMVYREYIDEIAVYDKVLIPDRIRAHYNAWAPKDCTEIKERQMAAQWEGIDKNEDCLINFTDYALFAQEWALCNRPGDLACFPNWP